MCRYQLWPQRCQGWSSQPKTTARTQLEIKSWSAWDWYVPSSSELSSLYCSIAVYCTFLKWKAPYENESDICSQFLLSLIPVDRPRLSRGRQWCPCRYNHRVLCPRNKCVRTPFYLSIAVIHSYVWVYLPIHLFPRLQNLHPRCRCVTRECYLHI